MPPAPKQMRITLVAGKKDHGPGEHDYPAWQIAWKELLKSLDKLEVATAWEWPAEEDFAKSDVLVFYRHGDWSEEKAKQIDAFLKRGGGLVYIHWAVDGGQGLGGLRETHRPLVGAGREVPAWPARPVVQPRIESSGRAELRPGPHGR